MTQTDRQLVQRLLAGNKDAFTSLYKRYCQPLTYHLVCLVGDRETAEDLAQEVFVNLWKRARQWRGEESLKPWLWRQATNRGIDHLRSRKRRQDQHQRAPLDIAAAGGPVDNWAASAELRPGARLEAEERHHLVRDMIAALPAEKRQVFHLVYFNQMDLRQTAQYLGVPEGTVKSRLYHGRLEIARRWQQLEAQEEN